MKNSLKGFSLTQSYTGKSSLLQSPPWHFVGDVIAVYFEADEAKIKQFIPDGMKINNNTCAAYFIEWQRTTENGMEYLDPVNSLYSETIILLSAMFEGEAISFSPFVWMDLDTSFFSGILQGWPNRIGTTRLTRAFNLVSKAAPVIGLNGRFGATLTARERRLIDAEITLKEKTDQLPLPNFSKIINHRFLPNVSIKNRDIPLVNDFVQVKSRDSSISEIWKGDAKINFYIDLHSELGDLKPLKVLSGYRFSLATTVDDLTIIKDFSV